MAGAARVMTPGTWGCPAFAKASARQAPQAICVTAFQASIIFGCFFLLGDLDGVEFFVEIL